jgi:AraC family transcriptional regulator of adaptative response/methylated-DNA-[protein]-cysteine methyltransferase
MKHLPEHLRYTTGHCRFGGLLLAICDEGVAAILLGDEDGPMVADLQQRFPKATLEEDSSGLKKDMQALLTYVDHPLGTLQLQRPLAAHGSDFQKTVWAELSKIPAGQTITYTELAKRIGNPAAVRAVAGACAANPLAMVVPCHRVLRSDGGISGYRWGVERKIKLIELERELAAGTGA